MNNYFQNAQHHQTFFRKTLPIVLLFVMFILASPVPVKAASYYWQCPATESITIGLDDLVEFPTLDPLGGQFGAIVTGYADLRESGEGAIEFQKEITNGTEAFTERYLCLQSGDSLDLHIRFVQFYGEYFVEPLGEFDVTVFKSGYTYQVEWCTQYYQTTLFTDWGEKVKSCSQANAINVFVDGKNSYGTHLSLWFSTPEAANKSIGTYPTVQPFANSVVNRRPLAQPLPPVQKSSPPAAQPAQPAPTAPVSMVDTMIANIRANRSGIANRYPTQAEQLAQGLNAHLADFRVAGITPDRMAGILATDNAAMRMIAAVNGVWGDWDVNLCQKYDWDHYSEDPTGKVRPFRQLIIRLIQGHQGTLSDAEQRSLESYFTRSEDFGTWQHDMNAIIGAINKAFFPQ